jgi:hypothetical protein
VTYLRDESAQTPIPRAWHGLGIDGGRAGETGEGVTGMVAHREGVMINDDQVSPTIGPLFILSEPLVYRTVPRRHHDQ